MVTSSFFHRDIAARLLRYDQMVEWMLALHRQRQAAHTPQEQNVLAGRIEATDRQIDRVVYVLGGISPLRVTSATACFRSFTPNFRYTCCRWVRTVLMLNAISSAICR